LEFASPDGVPQIAEALADAGFPDVSLYVVIEASATSDDADLQVLHDRVKALAPIIDAADSGRTRITRA
jgi:hypothetical protein